MTEAQRLFRMVLDQIAANTIANTALINKILAADEQRRRLYAATADKPNGAMREAPR